MGVTELRADDDRLMPGLPVTVTPGDRLSDAELLTVMSGVEVKVATLKVDTGDVVDVKKDEIL